MNKEYHDIHKWLIKTFGKADLCTSESCTKKSIKYEWALIKGMEYAVSRENFTKLCTSCHRKYDVTEEGRLARSQRMKGVSIPRKQMEKMAKGKYKPVGQYDLEGKLVATYDSIKSAVKATGILNSSITMCAQGKPRHATAGGYVWLYLKKENLL